MSKKRKSAASKAALEMYLVRKIFSPEVQIAKESIEEFCIAKEMNRFVGMSAFLRSALAQYLYAITNLGYNEKETKTIIKRFILLTLDSIEIEKK